MTFTDGTPLTSEAIKANIEHLQNPATASSTGYLAVGKVQSVEIVDDLTARLHLTAPDSALLESLSQPWTAIESPTALARSFDENCADPVGTGPFKVDSWTKQDSISLVRNDDYVSTLADAGHEGPAYLDAIEWRFIPDSATRYAALQSGEVDVIDNAQPDSIAAARSGDGINELDAPRPGVVESHRAELGQGSVQRRARAGGVRPRRRREPRHRVVVLRHGRAVILGAVERRAPGHF